MTEKKAYRARLQATASSASLTTLDSEKVESGEVVVLEQVAWEIDKVTSGGNTRARLYIKGHGYKHFLEEQQVPEADTLYTYNEILYLYESEQLALEIDQAQNATNIKMYLTGYSTCR